MFDSWTDWRLFPEPRLGQLLVAPFGPGLFELRLAEDPIMFGIGQSVASRMTALIPYEIKPEKRSNSSKRRFLTAALGRLEYRTMSCRTRDDAERAAQALAMRNYRFRT